MDAGPPSRRSQWHRARTSAVSRAVVASAPSVSAASPIGGKCGGWTAELTTTTRWCCARLCVPRWLLGRCTCETVGAAWDAGGLTSHDASGNDRSLTTWARCGVSAYAQATVRGATYATPTKDVVRSLNAL